MGFGYYGGSAMMGWFGPITMIIWTVAGVLLVVWLWQQVTKK